MTAFFRTYPFGLLTIILITVLSLMPAQEFPQVNVQFADKWTHWVMYGYLTLVMGVEAIRHKRKCIRRGLDAGRPLTLRFLCIMLLSGLWGMLMEVCQSYLTTTRHGDWLDALANCFGALCAFIALSAYNLYTREA